MKDRRAKTAGAPKAKSAWAMVDGGRRADMSGCMPQRTELTSRAAVLGRPDQRGDRRRGTGTMRQMRRHRARHEGGHREHEARSAWHAGGGIYLPSSSAPAGAGGIKRVERQALDVQHGPGQAGAAPAMCAWSNAESGQPTVLAKPAISV